jgi:hypothetical protein
MAVYQRVRSDFNEQPGPYLSKIDTGNQKELKSRINALGVSKEEVLHTIDKVGNSAAAVGKELGSGKSLEPDGFLLTLDGTIIKKQDGSPIAETSDYTLRWTWSMPKEEKWSA